MTGETTILLVDDHPVMRKGLREVLNKKESLHVIGEAVDGQEAIDKVRQLQPDVVVMDVNMPRLNGIQATRQILAVSPQTRVLALSIHSGKRYVEEMIEAGVAGYLLKENAPEELVKAIYALKEGKGYLCSEITDIVLRKVRQSTLAGQMTASHSTAHSMASKLRKPPVPAGIVHRRELVERLEQGRHKQLSLVVAPAGYGKSTLVCDWLEKSEHPHAWWSLDTADNDLGQFLKSWMVSLDGLFPSRTSYLRPLVETANLPPVSILAGAMVAELEKLPEAFIFVLDNIHLVTEKAISDLLSQLRRQRLRSMHLVLISRHDLFLPIKVLRAENQLTEIRVHDLKFSAQEIKTFLEKVLDKTVDIQTAASWEERTEGWVNGLQLAVHTLASGDVDAALTTASENLVDWRQVLTNREFEVLLLLQQRLRDKEIADQLCISVETVKTHLKNLYQKLDAADRRDAVVKARKLQILN